MAGIAVGVLAVVWPWVVAWSWRRGRLSDVAAARCILGWAPTSCLAAALVSGPGLLALAAFVLPFIPGVLLYRTLVELLREQRGSAPG